MTVEFSNVLRRWALVFTVCTGAAASGVQVASHAQETRGSFARLTEVQR